MAANKKILLHLGKKDVAFEVVKHRKVFTAYDLAQTVGEELDKIAKALLVKVELPDVKKKDQRHYVVIVPASYHLDLAKIKKQLKATKVEIAPERVMKKLGIEPGAISPFGSVRGLGVAVDKSLLKGKEMIVGAESFTESIRLKVKDFIKAEEEAVIGLFGKDNKMKSKRKKIAQQEAKRVAKKPVKKKASAKKPAKKKTAAKKPVKKAPAKKAPVKKLAKKVAKKAAPKRKSVKKATKRK
jgi:prolyl-tRNA editing enzyme YbaK/EbsC (Cys-tRNA(Pro) deacylase)